MLLSKTVELKWNSKIKKHYVDYGYEYTKMGDTFIVDVFHLTNGSNIKVDVKCDYCGKTYQKYWHRFLKENKNCTIHKDCCSECKKHKIIETSIEKYGVNSVFELKDIQDKIKLTNLKVYGVENPFQSEEIKQKISETNLERYGVSNPLKSDTIKEKSRNTCMQRYGVPNYNMFCHPPKGELSPKWKGGATYHREERSTFEYNNWRKQVFNRDFYTCQCCGDRNGHGYSVKLCAHHIKNWKDYPDERYIVDNGITLCEECHKEFHSRYGKKNNNGKQLNEFLSIHGKKVC